MIPVVNVADWFLFVVEPTETVDYRIQLRLNFGGSHWREWRLSGGYIEHTAWWQHPKFPVDSAEFSTLEAAKDACNTIARFLEKRYCKN